MEYYTPLNGSSGNSARLRGGRRRLRMVTKKRARNVLRKFGLKMRGGEMEGGEMEGGEMEGGRRRRRQTRRRKFLGIF